MSQPSSSKEVANGKKQDALPGRAPPEKASEFSDSVTTVPEVGEEICLPRFPSPPSLSGTIASPKAWFVSMP